MDLVNILSILSVVIMLFASIQFLQIWIRFKKLHEGDVISNQLATEVGQKLRVGIFLLAIGCMIGLIGVLIRPF